MTERQIMFWISEQEKKNSQKLFEKAEIIDGRLDGWIVKGPTLATSHHIGRHIKGVIPFYLLSIHQSSYLLYSQIMSCQVVSQVQIWVKLRPLWMLREDRVKLRHGAGSYEISYSVLLKHLSSNLTKSFMSRGQLCISVH